MVAAGKRGRIVALAVREDHRARNKACANSGSVAWIADEFAQIMIDQTLGIRAEAGLQEKNMMATSKSMGHGGCTQNALIYRDGRCIDR
jgi:hypothetical protein